VLQSKQYNYFRIAAAFSLVLAAIVAIFVIIYGKNASFILIHNYYNTTLDYFFWSCTFLGDGFILIPIVLLCFFFQKDFLIPVIAGIIICLFITHFLKRVVFPDQLRPVGMEQVVENLKLRRVLGLELYKSKSFPSGHTSTAFSMSLLLVCLFQRKIWCFILPFIAFLVGYSRVYLGQHYVTDVLAGILIGILSAFLALKFYKWILRRRAKKMISIIN